MSDKLLYQNLFEEQGFDGQTAGTLGTTVGANEEGSTYTADIAQTAPMVGYSHSIASKTLPAILGYVQPMNSPSGFVFSMKTGPAVNQTADMPYLNDGTGNPESGTAGPEDLQITRTPVVTNIREVKMDCTNELVQDIDKLFGPNFDRLFKNYLYYDGTDIDIINDFETTINPQDTQDTQTYDEPNDSDLKLSKFFIEYATWRMSRKTNIDFITWLNTVATNLGAYDITDFNDIGNIKGVVAELKDNLYSGTGKTGRTWVLGSPKIINYLLMTTTCTPDNTIIRNGKRIPTTKDYNYVFSCGETDYYQDINITDKVYVGLQGTASVTSVFYTPYKEYFVQGGEDFYTGQSNIWFRLRDDFVLNPLDTGTGTGDSNFVLSADITFSVGTLLN